MKTFLERCWLARNYCWLYQKVYLSSVKNQIFVALTKVLRRVLHVMSKLSKWKTWMKLRHCWMIWFSESRRVKRNWIVYNNYPRFYSSFESPLKQWKKRRPKLVTSTWLTENNKKSPIISQVFTFPDKRLPIFYFLFFFLSKINDNYTLAVIHYISLWVDKFTPRLAKCVTNWRLNWIYKAVYNNPEILQCMKKILQWDTIKRFKYR